MEFKMYSIGIVRNSRHETIDDSWKGIISEIQLDKNLPVEVFAIFSPGNHLVF